MFVGRNLAIRWDEEDPRIGVDPDVCIITPAPPRVEAVLGSVRTWVDGHAPPLVAAEIVSSTNADKDYVEAPDKYAASGTRELSILDPLHAGPTKHGGPFRLQVWPRDEADRFERVYAGEGPAYSTAVEGWLVPTNEGRVLRLADAEDGAGLWPTGEEAERAAKEAALARVAELEKR